MTARHLTPLTVLLLLAGVAAGCATCRVPAIDPTGAGLFSGTTTLNPASDCALIPRTPRPAWTTPAYPPPCGSGTPLVVAPASVAAVPVVADNCPDAYAPTLTVTPQRFVAPVGTDVVLVAGMCGRGHHANKHFYVMRQPLEWMLAPEGVGYIVEVGKENCPLTRLVSATPNKVDTTYAKAHTSTVRQIITRGTGRAEDDIELAKGQSWISVSSPNEGTSYVTVLAPAENNWEARKQTATIYWVDAKWTFPAPVVIRPSEPHRLTTKLVRSSGLPIAGWIVRYDILDGPPAAFGAGNEKTIEVATDVNGEANVDLLPQSKDAGISQIRIQIIRPDPRPGEQPMLVGQGFTQVQWSTPGLVLRGAATQQARADGIINYELQVVNNGDQLTRDVVLSFTPPAGITVIGSTIQGQTFGNRLEWRLGNLNPQETRPLNIQAKAAMPGDFQSCFTASSAEFASLPPTCFTTNVPGTALRISVQEPPNPNVNVGDLVQYRVQIQNTSGAVVTGVRVIDTFDAGLEHYDSQRGAGSGETSPIDRQPFNLQAGQTEQFALTFRVTQPGDQCHRIDVAAENGQRFSQQFCVRAAAGAAAIPGPAIPAPIDTNPGPPVAPMIPGPAAAVPAGLMQVQSQATEPEIIQGKSTVFQVRVTNAGTTALTNLRIDMTPSKGLNIIAATENEQRFQKSFFWTIARLEPGQTALREVEAVGVETGGQGIRSAAQADGVAPQTSDANINVRPAMPAALEGAANPLPINPASTVIEPPAAANLKVVLDRTGNPLLLNKETTFIVSIKNEGKGADQNVTVRMKFPPGLKFVKVSDAPTGVNAVGDDARTIDLAPIQELRPGEKLADCKFVVQATTPGDYVIEAQVFSATHPDGITKNTTLNVFSR